LALKNFPGQHLPIGDQRDVTEYHTNFLSRIEEAFSYQEAHNRVYYFIYDFLIFLGKAKSK